MSARRPETVRESSATVAFSSVPDSGDRVASSSVLMIESRCRRPSRSRKSNASSKSTLGIAFTLAPESSSRLRGGARVQVQVRVAEQGALADRDRGVRVDGP